MNFIEKIRSCSPSILNGKIILKAFGIDIEKSRTGVYTNNPQNRRLKRVGQKYGNGKKQEESKIETTQKEQQPKSGKFQYDENKIKQFTKKASKQQLKSYIEQEKNHPEIKRIAQEELQSRMSDKQLGEHGKKTSEKDLQRTIKEHKDPRMRVAAHKEIERRGKEEKPQKKENKRKVV